MNRFDHQWEKLVTLARQAPVDPAAVPYGFATRVAAQAATQSGNAPWLSLERFALRGLFVAATCCVAAMALNYVAFKVDVVESYTAGTAPIYEMLDLS